MSKFVKVATTHEMANQPAECIEMDGEKIALFPRLDAEIRYLIRRMARENPTWGRRRIQAELALLGSKVAELTVAQYMPRTSPRPSATRRAFLAGHARDIVAVDLSLVP